MSVCLLGLVGHNYIQIFVDQCLWKERRSFLKFPETSQECSFLHNGLWSGLVLLNWMSVLHSNKTVNWIHYWQNFGCMGNIVKTDHCWSYNIICCLTLAIKYLYHSAKTKFLIWHLAIFPFECGSPRSLDIQAIYLPAISTRLNSADSPMIFLACLQTLLCLSQYFPNGISEPSVLGLEL